jgi:hypothetical protein
MRVEAKMRRHRLDCIVGCIGVHRPLLAGFGFILDPRRFDQPKWHSCLASRRYSNFVTQLISGS